MAFYRTTQQLYICAEQLFYRIMEEDPKAGDGMTSARLAIHLRTTDPVGEILINGRSRPLLFQFGVDGVQPDLDITLTADTLHLILKGELGLRQAMNQKRLQVRGPVFKAMMLAPLFHHTQKVYPAILREQGLA